MSEGDHWGCVGLRVPVCCKWRRGNLKFDYKHPLRQSILYSAPLPYFAFHSSLIPYGLCVEMPSGDQDTPLSLTHTGTHGNRTTTIILVRLSRLECWWPCSCAVVLLYWAFTCWKRGSFHSGVDSGIGRLFLNRVVRVSWMRPSLGCKDSHGRREMDIHRTYKYLFYHHYKYDLLLLLVIPSPKQVVKKYIYITPSLRASLQDSECIWVGLNSVFNKVNEGSK